MSAPLVQILVGDVRERLLGLPDESVHCVVTSPPYWGLRDYGADGQLGLEPTIDKWVENQVAVFREVRRVLRGDGTLWLNLGDAYATGAGKVGNCPGGGAQGANWKGPMTAPNRMPQPGLKPKDLIGQPWRLAFALQADGWWLRSDIIWHKPNPMPESVTDRPTKSHEHVFLLAKSARYYYDAEAVREVGCCPGANSQRKDAGKLEQKEDPVRFKTRPVGRTCGYPERRNLRDVWTIPTHAFPGAHFATFPPKLVEPCVKAGCPEGGTVLDPYGGSGTTALVAARLNRGAILVELNPEYAELARDRILGDAPLFLAGKVALC